MSRTGRNTRRWTALLLLLVGLTVAGCAKRVDRAPVTASSLPAAARVIRHEVGQGETLARIADNYYGDPARATDIARVNGLADPDRVTTGSVLRLDFQSQEWDSARRRASALEPYNRGVDMLAKDRFAEAERQFRLAIETAPELLSARYNLALVLIKRGRHGDALPLLEALTELRPADTDFRFARGHVLFLMTRFREAVAQFRLVLDEDVGHLRASFGLARSLQESGQIGAARQAWLRYLELDDSSGWAVSARRYLRDLADDGG